MFNGLNIKSSQHQNKYWPECAKTIVILDILQAHNQLRFVATNFRHGILGSIFTKPELADENTPNGITSGSKSILMSTIM